MAISINTIPTPLMTGNDGIIRVSNTRVTLDVVLAAFNNGSTPEEIAWQYPVLDLADVYASITYYLRNRDELDEYLRQRQETRKKIRQENERRFPTAGIRERLLSRRTDG